MPIHATAAGKSLVAYDSEEEIRKRFPGTLQKYTSSTITTVEGLLKDLEKVRDVGYATDLEEFEEGLRCIASPVRDYTRKVVGALSISGPANRLTDERIRTVEAPLVVGIAGTLSDRLGFRE
jgi:DNA-binding IclR family transcriptional regulator